jgi:glycosyltransferase involved in cell wall biosynthesis
VEYWRGKGAKCPLHMIRNCTPAPPRDFADLQQRSGHELVVFAGRLSPEKNVQVMLQALISVASRRPSLRAKVFGEGPLSRSLAESIRETELQGRIELAGVTADLASWLRAASACISVSLFEGNPNVVLEAAAVGCPLVVSDIAAHREILDEETALFVPTHPAEAVAAGIQRALDDPTAARMRARRAADRARGWTAESVADKYLAAYSETLARRRRPTLPP